MRYLFVIVLISVFSVSCIAQKIIGGEYFIDNYVQQGSGTQFMLESPSYDTTLSFNIDVSALEHGIHTLYVRTLNDSSQWSHTSQRMFYIHAPLVQSELVGFEYTIDNYQKQGEGTYAPISTENSYEIDVSSLEEGTHILYARSKNSNGIWSTTSQRMFIVAGESEISKIASLEYFYKNNEFVSDTFQYNGFTSTTNLDLSNSGFYANTNGLEYNKTYDLYIRAVCENGTVSSYYKQSFEYKEIVSSVNASSLYSIEVYPNPITDIVYLRAEPSIVQNGEYFLYSQDGKLLKQGKVLKESINMEEYSNGVYILVIKSGRELYSTKLVKE